MRLLGALACGLSLLCTTLPAFEKESSCSSETGVLIVTYNTGRNAERLDRIRFRLVNDHKEQRMLPQAGEFLDSPSSQSRRVIVRNLPVGRYSLEFIIPNFDGLFSEVPQREVLIVPGEIAKVDQAIKPRYARVKVTAVVPDGSSAPRVLLCNTHGVQVARGTQGELVSSNLIPGEYVVMFERKTGYREPDPIRISVAAGAVLGPFERHYVPLNEKVVEQSAKALQRPIPAVAKETAREPRGVVAPHLTAGGVPSSVGEAASREFSPMSLVVDLSGDVQQSTVRPLRHFTPGVTESQLTSPDCQRCPDHCKNRFWTNFDAETCGLLPCCVDVHSLYTGEGESMEDSQEKEGGVWWEATEAEEES